MRDINTAGRKIPTAFDNALPIEFKVDGESYTAYPPTPGQIAMLMQAQADSRDYLEGIAAIIDFLDGILDEEAQAMFRRRLMDRNDPFDFDTVNELVEGLIEEWSGDFPTKPPSDSSTSHRSVGVKSTAKRRSTVKTSAP